MKNTVKTILVSASVVTGMFILGTQANADTVTVASGDTVSKIIDMIPEVVDKITTAMGKNAPVDTDDKAIKDAIDQISGDEQI